MAAIIALDSMSLVHHFLVTVLLLIIPWAAPLSFDFPTFHQSNLTNGTGLLITKGDAVIANQSIHLTKDNVGRETTNGSIGRATYGEPFLLWDKSTRKLADFNTSFTFRFDGKNSSVPSYDQGLAFFLAPNGSILNRALGAGGNMGLPVNSSVENVTEPSNRYPFVVVEFVTFRKSKSRRRKKRMGVVISSAIGGFILACILALGLYNSCKKRATGGRADIDLTIPNELGEKIAQKKFSYKELARATRNFSDGELLGVGRYGAFYKGYIKEWNIHVAVKKMLRSELVLKDYSSQVTIISRINHRNLVRLLGWCQQKGELLLVYEFMPNGSLYNYLFKAHISLVWEVRYKIARDLASILDYLHEACVLGILHGGIASSNIMLDSDFNAKLGDFRLARHPREKHWDTMLLAPEYAATQTVTKEFDVYNFGVVALEISCGRKAVEPRLENGRVNIIEWVLELYGEGKIIEAADSKLCGSFDGKQMECLLIVGLWCAHPDYSSRPSMRQVIQCLPLLLTYHSHRRLVLPAVFKKTVGRSSGHGYMDNANSLVPERVVESLDPSEPLKRIVIFINSNDQITILFIYKLYLCTCGLHTLNKLY